MANLKFVRLYTRITHNGALRFRRRNGGIGAAVEANDYAVPYDAFSIVQFAYAGTVTYFTPGIRREASEAAYARNSPPKRERIVRRFSCTPSTMVSS